MTVLLLKEDKKTSFQEYKKTNENSYVYKNTIKILGPDYMANFSPASETNPLKIKLSITWRFFQPGATGLGFSARAKLRPGLKKFLM